MKLSSDLRYSSEIDGRVCEISGKHRKFPGDRQESLEVFGWSADIFGSLCVILEKSLKVLRWPSEIFKVFKRSSEIFRSLQVKLVNLRSPSGVLWKYCWPSTNFGNLRSNLHWISFFFLYCFLKTAFSFPFYLTFYFSAKSGTVRIKK